MGKFNIPLQHLWKALDNGDNVTLAGSMALAYHGLLNINTVHDVDLRILNPTQKQTKLLDDLQALNPSPKFIPGGKLDYSFFLFGCKFDIWVIDMEDVGTINPENQLYTSDIMRIADINSIVAHKVNAGRAKDWIQLMQLARRIFNPVFFDIKLPDIKSGIADYGDNLEATNDEPSNTTALLKAQKSTLGLADSAVIFDGAVTPFNEQLAARVAEDLDNSTTKKAKKKAPVKSEMEQALDELLTDNDKPGALGEDPELTGSDKFVEDLEKASTSKKKLDFLD